jgi:hypothetical protein
MGQTRRIVKPKTKRALRYALVSRKSGMRHMSFVTITAIQLARSHLV